MLENRFILTIAACCLSGSVILAQTVRQITDHRVDVQTAAAISDAGDRIVLLSSADPLGTNPTHSFQIFAYDFPGPTLSQVTQLDEGVGGSRDVENCLSITDDGQTIAFISPANPVGLNADGSLESFIAAVDGSSIVQLTATTYAAGGAVLCSIISGSGNRVIFTANTNPLGSNPLHHEQLFVIDSDGSELTQLTAVSEANTFFSGISISDDGEKVVFSTGADLTGENPVKRRQIFQIVVSEGVVRQRTAEHGCQSALSPTVSGNGQVLLFRCDSSVFAGDWEQGTLTQLEGIGGVLSVSDDGLWAHGSGFAGIVRVATSGDSTESITVRAKKVTVSGSGERVVFEGPYVNPFLTEGEVVQWSAVNFDGSGMQVITANQHQWKVREPAATPGTRRSLQTVRR